MRAIGQPTGERIGHGGLRQDDARQGNRGAGDVTTWVYEAATGLLLSKTDAPTPEHPAGKTVLYAYNPRGQLATRTWARGVVTTYGYDSQTAEQLSISYPAGTTNLGYTYNRLGQNVTVTDATGTHTLDHCLCGKISQETFDATFYGGRTFTINSTRWPTAPKAAPSATPSPRAPPPSRT